MFKLILKLAWKNAFLRLSRTLLVVLMIAVSMSMMLSLQGIYDGMTSSRIDKTKRSDCGELALYNPHYRLNKSLDDVIKNAKEIEATLKKRSDVKAVVRRLSVDGLSATAHKSEFSSVIGINIDEENAFGRFDKFLVDGRLELGKRGALIGKELAKSLKVHVGSKVIFSTQDSSGEINAMAVKIRGIIQTSNVVLDRSALYVERKHLERFLGVSDTVATQIAIRTDSTTLQALLQKRYPQLKVMNFLELYPMLKQMQDVMKIFNSITFFIVILVVFIGILGVMYVSVLDRIREFGIMRAVGMEYKYIRTEVFFEAIFVGLVGYAVGAVLGLLSLLYLQHYGLNLSQFSDGLASFGLDTVLYADISPIYFTNTFLAILSASFLSVLLPLRKIKHLNPIEVIKAET